MCYEKYSALQSWHLSDKFALGAFHVLAFVIWVVLDFTFVFVYCKPQNHPPGFLNFLLRKIQCSIAIK